MANPKPRRSLVRAALGHVRNLLLGRNSDALYLAERFPDESLGGVAMVTYDPRYESSAPA